MSPSARLSAAACAVLMLFGGGARAVTPAELYYERSLMTAADARCGLFSDELAAALESARAQARSAALRAGTDEAALQTVAARAQARARSSDCGSADLSTAAGRVRSAFEAYARLTRMTFPGDLSQWRAERGDSVQTASWRLAQTVSFGWDKATFGIAGRDGSDALVAVAVFADGASPYAARLLLRDVARAPKAHIDASAASGRAQSARRAPPRAAMRVVLAEARLPADAGLLPTGTRQGTAFRFPLSAADALARLDPRESVAIEFVFSGPRGDVARTAYVEVGDFAAGRAFLKVARR